MPPKYEYKTVAFGGKEVYQKEGHDEYMTILNSCGKDGWELVSAYCWSVAGKNEHQYYFKRELQEEPQVDETEVNTDEILSGMNNLNVDTEPPAPTPGVFAFGTPAPTPGVFTFGTPAPASENPPDAGTEVEILRRDLDDLRTDFDRVRRKLCRNLGDGFITKEEQFEELKRPSDFKELHRQYHHRQYPRSFQGMSNKEYRAWKDDFEAHHIQKQKNQEIQREGERKAGVPSLEEEQIAKERLEAELQRVLAIEHEAEKMAKLRAYNEAEAEAKAQKEHFTRTGEFMSKSE
jgi:hypothetical protein